MDSKDELIIDYVESACDKQIKQKSCTQNVLSSSNQTICNSSLCGNGSKSVIDGTKIDNFVSIEKNDSKKFEEPPKQMCSVKEKIMLFTQNSGDRPTISKVFEPKLSKSILVTSTPSINESVDAKSNFSVSIPKNLNTSFTISKPSINNSKKFKSTSTLNKNFTSQPNISFVEMRPEFVDSIVIKDEPTTKIQQEENSLPKFRSVKEKIAYFSSKSSKPAWTNKSPATKKVIDSQKKIIGNIPSKIEIIKPNDISIFEPVSEEYDSLKNAYRLNSIAYSAIGNSKTF